LGGKGLTPISIRVTVKKRNKNPGIGIISLGCAKNLIDSERILGVLGASGFAICAEPEDADAVIVNTCAFIEAARRESVEAINYALSLKRAGRISRVIVAGCLAQRYRESVLDDIPGVDAVVGIHDFESFPRVFRSIFDGAPDKRPNASSTFRLSQPVRPDTGRLRITPRHFAYLRISEGCDNCCAYCAIPEIRGPLRSKPFDAVVEEARELAADGAREIIVVGQDTTSYGRDIYKNNRLPELVRRLAAVNRVRWIRILYTHPAHYSDEFIEIFSDTPKLLPYVDVPIQHSSDRVLERMGRGVKRCDLEALVEKLRRRIKGLALRTSIIVGFPGETDEDFAGLLDFIRAVRFDRLGAFAYSQEEGTPAAGFDGQVSGRVKQERLHELMTLQQEISLETNRQFIGRQMEVVIDEVSGRAATARSYREAPDVDGAVLLRSKKPLKPGQFIKVKITAAGPYDLNAVTV